MLSLESPHWSELTHAYGSAADIPNLLQQLRIAPHKQNSRSEPWFSIWSALCHQSDVYTATYAAVSHIVDIAKSKSPHEQFDYLFFVGYAEACRHHKSSPKIPADLEFEYLSALNDAAELFIAGLKLTWDEEETKVLLGGLAVLRGFPKLGEVIIELDSTLQCLNCEYDLSGGLF